MRVLLVEDNALLGDGIRSGLEQAGLAVDWLKDGAEAEAALADFAFDVVVLDLGLPNRSGMDILNGMRKRGCDVPVLILTARDTVEDRIAGLDAGADDYMIKPFDLEELAARLRAIHRRHLGRSWEKLQYGEMVVDPSSHTVTIGKQLIDLSRREFTLLLDLLENSGRVLSRSRLEQSLYGWRDDIASNALEVHIHHLRRKLGKDLIRTVRGVGYIIPRQNGEAPSEARANS